MTNTKVIAVVAVAILAIIAVGAFVLLSDDGDDEYRSTNTDCRLQILGNADENDYLDQDDVAKIKEMIDEGAPYKLIADANNDGKITQADADMVQKIIDAKKQNAGKEYKDKTKVKVNYISVDENVLQATYPIGKMIVINSQRAIELVIALGLDDMVAGYSDIDDYWDDNEYTGLEGLPNVGVRKEPNLEEIMKIDADTIYTGKANKCCKNIEGTQFGSKQLIRLATWENGGLENGALMLAFFADKDKFAEDYVKWMDDLNAEIQEKLKDVPNKKDLRFIATSSANSLCVQMDGFSSALDKLGATNVGNLVVTNPEASYGKAAEYKEQIKKEDPQLHILGVYIMSQMTDAEVKAKYDSYDFEPNFGGTTAYKENNYSMIDYGMPFCLITLCGAHIMFEDVFSMDYVEDKVQEYLELYTNVPDGFKVDMDHVIYYPS